MFIVNCIIMRIYEVNNIEVCNAAPPHAESSPSTPDAQSHIDAHIGNQ